MFKTIVAAIFVALGAMLFALPSFACDGGKVIYDDTFTKLNPAWGFTAATNEAFGTDGYTADFPPNNYRRGLSQLSYYDDYVVCATMTMDFLCTDTSKCETQGYVGLVYLGADNSNFYTFDVSPPFGSYSISRMQKDRWLAPVGWTSLPAGISFKAGEPIELQATVKDNNIKFKINGSDVLDFDAIGPDDGSLVGFEISSQAADTQNTKFAITDYKVMELPQ